VRKRTGLRNRWRQGLSTYAKHQKGKSADGYGSWQQGVKTRDEVIAGRTLNYRPGRNTLTVPAKRLVEVSD
jgi:hypothetical protein